MMHFRWKRSPWFTRSLFAPTLAGLLALGACGGKPSQGSSQVTAEWLQSPLGEGSQGPGGGPRILKGAGHGDPQFIGTQLTPAIQFLDKTFGR